MSQPMSSYSRPSHSDTPRPPAQPRTACQQCTRRVSGVHSLLARCAYRPATLLCSLHISPCLLHDTQCPAQCRAPCRFGRSLTSAPRLSLPASLSLASAAAAALRSARFSALLAAALDFCN